jgi:hypothetical protein
MVTSMIFSHAPEDVRCFSDAFRLGPDDE